MVAVGAPLVAGLLSASILTGCSSSPTGSSPYPDWPDFCQGWLSGMESEWDIIGSTAVPSDGDVEFVAAVGYLDSKPKEALIYCGEDFSKVDREPEGAGYSAVSQGPLRPALHACNQDDLGSGRWVSIDGELWAHTRSTPESQTPQTNFCKLESRVRGNWFRVSDPQELFLPLDEVAEQRNIPALAAMCLNSMEFVGPVIVKEGTEAPGETLPILLVDSRGVRKCYLGPSDFSYDGYRVVLEPPVPNSDSK